VGWGGICIQHIDRVEFILQQIADLVQYDEHCYTSMAKKLAGHVESFNMGDPEVELRWPRRRSLTASCSSWMKTQRCMLLDGLCPWPRPWPRPNPSAMPMVMPTATVTPMVTAMLTAPPTATPTANPIDLGVTVKSVMDSVSEMKATNVNINVVVVTGGNTT
jgi:hypothetical protein